MKTLAATAALLITAVAGATFATAASADGLTREQVRAQLVEAQREGVVPTTPADYPPSASEIARNRTTYQAQFGKSDEPARWVSQG
jgi:hypothetical protein